jgi:hypothetical protein
MTFMMMKMKRMRMSIGDDADNNGDDGSYYVDHK